MKSTAPYAPLASFPAVSITVWLVSEGEPISGIVSPSERICLRMIVVSLGFWMYISSASAPDCLILRISAV